MSFVNLHTHSHYSLLDGFGSPEDIILRAKELKCPAIALTDHGVTHGLIEFYKAGIKEGVKPILGCEGYIAPRTRFDKEAKIDNRPFHITLLAKNNVGYQNLIKLVTKANLEGYYYKPRIDYGLLKAYSEGLIVLSGCLQGHLPRLILSNDEEGIKKQMELYLEILDKKSFYLEIQDHPLIEDQEIVNNKILKLAKEYKLPVVLTNDSHYPRVDDKEVHDIMLCIQTQTNVNDETRMKYTGDFSIRDLYSECKNTFEDFSTIMENSLKIADDCNVSFEFGKNLMPLFRTPNNEKCDIYLTNLCKEGLTNRFKDKEVPKDYWERLDYELQVVHKMGFDSYFLIVADLVNYAKGQGIVVGPGRGSAAGSIMAWSLNITELDPILHGLFFERFLNPERISMPDIDIDFADHRRNEVLSYVVGKYGRENVAQVLTFGTMAPRAAVRDVGRALGYPYKEVDQLAKSIPPPVLGKQTPLKISIKEDAELKKVYETNERARKLLDIAKKIEGTVRHVGTHACAVIISEQPLTNYTALQYSASGDEKEIVTQYSAKPLEDLGLLKMDFLGLRNLTVIEKTCKIIKRTRELDIDIVNLPLDDEGTFKLIQNADTTGVFQFESAGMRRYLKDLKATKFDDIVAMGALYRPGPMEWIPNYIKGKHNPEKISYLHESFKPILQNTYGVAVYQEQILQIARDFAGFSLGEADILRKAVGKKIAALLEAQKEQFVKGAVKKGQKEKFAIEVFEKVIEPFAGYGFNKAHAVCYGLIAYQTAFLKAHFPIEFMTALLCSDANNMDRVVLEINECLEMGISVLPPSINDSFSHFTVVDEKTIRFGLLAIKGVGEGPIRLIIEERDKNGRFKSLEDFLKRVPCHLVNKKTISSLALSGAFDEFGDRNQIAENFEALAKFSKSIQEKSTNGQTNIFGMLTEESSSSYDLVMEKAIKLTPMQKLKWEKDLLGMYVSGHPLKGLKKYIKRKVNLIESLTLKQVGKPVKVLGILSGLRKILTRGGTYMASFLIEDSTAKVNVIIFPKVYSKFMNIIVNDAIVVLSGKFDRRQGVFQIMCDNVKVISFDNMLQNAKDEGYFDENEKSSFAIRLIDDILAPLTEEQVVPVDKIPTDESDKSVSDERSYVIEISSTIPKEIMQNLKNLLLRHAGDTPVEIRLKDLNSVIKLPFGVNISQELKDRVNALLS